MTHPPLILHEDADLLVIDKPPGWNTHAPDPYAGEGVYEWLRHREPRWADLAILHRLDKVTSGLLVFAKTPRANRALALQFEQQRVRKRYLLLSTEPGPTRPVTIRSNLVRHGDRYRSVPDGGLPAETCFRPAGREGRWHRIEVEPRTGRTHQIRVQAAAAGFPVLGDTLYGGAPHGRVCLHAAGIELFHPADDRPVVFQSAPQFLEAPYRAIRRAIIEVGETDVYRWVHGMGDGEADWFVDRLGPWWLSQSAGELTAARRERLAGWMEECGGLGVLHKTLLRQLRRMEPDQAAATAVLGSPPTGAFPVRENGLGYELALDQGYSIGLFPDQRDNRRRLLTRHVAAGFPLVPEGSWSVLNLFAYTCGFSVCAARAGARTVSVDLSRNALAWGRRHFSGNGMDPAEHEFLAGDAFEWLGRLGRKGRRFDVVILDPPTFSTGKGRGRFRAGSDYGRLVGLAVAVTRPGGVLLACTNAGTIEPADFCERIEQALAAAGRRVVQRHYRPQPPDFPISREQAAHLKTLWLRVD